MPAGRPQLQINWEEFDKLCFIQCTLQEIAMFFKCDRRTIERMVKREKKTNFATYYEEKRKAGFISLRRIQWKKALDGNPTMMVWLGKQYLQQEDVSRVNGEMNHKTIFEALRVTPPTKEES